MLKKKQSNRAPFKISYSLRNNWKCESRGARLGVLKEQEPFVNSAALCMGNGFHDLVDTMYVNVKKGLMVFSKDWLLDNWSMFFDDQVKKSLNKLDGIDQKREDGIDLINGFWELAKENDWLKVPIMNERFLSFKYRKYNVISKTDAVFEHDDNYEIVDWKTGGSKWLDLEENQQLVQYIACFKKEFKEPRMYGDTYIDLSKKKVTSSLVFPHERNVFRYSLKNSGMVEMKSDIDRIIDLVDENGRDAKLYKTNPSRDNCVFCQLNCSDKWQA